MSKRKKLSSQLNNVFNAANDSFSPLSLGNLAAWYRPGIGVTGTLTASNWADQSGNGRDLAQATAGNQPINLPHTGTDYAYLPGVVGNYFSTPDSAAADITGDIDIRVKAAMNDWTPAGQQAFVSKFEDSNARAYELRVETSGVITLGWTPGTDAQIISASSTVATGFINGELRWIRATLGGTSTQYIVRFFTSTDGVVWTPLGDSIVGVGATSIADVAGTLKVGGRSAGALLLLGRIYRAQIYDGINGTLAVDFDPSRFVETSTNGTTATMSTGEVWTLNSTGAYPATIVKSSQILFGGVDEYMKTASFTLNQPETVYIVFKSVTWTNAEVIFDGNGDYDGALRQYSSTPQLSIQADSGGGLPVGLNSGLAVGSYGIVTALFNGAASALYVNAGTSSALNPSTDNMGGFSLGAAGSGGGNFGNIIVKEVLIFSTAHTAAQRAQMISWLNSRYGTF